MAVTSGRHAQNDKKDNREVESDIRGGLKDPESVVREGWVRRDVYCEHLVVM